MKIMKCSSVVSKMITDETLEHPDHLHMLVAITPSEISELREFIHMWHNLGEIAYMILGNECTRTGVFVVENDQLLDEFATRGYA